MKRAAAIITLVGVILLLALTVIHRFPPSRRLPDGSLLAIAEVSYGLKHAYTISSLKPWQTSAMHYLPLALVEKLGWTASTGSVWSNADPGDAPFLVVHTLLQTGGADRSSPPDQLDVCDEAGNIRDSSSGGLTASLRDTAVRCWPMMKPIGGAKRLILRFSRLAADGQTRVVVAEFNVPSPMFQEPEVTVTNPWRHIAIGTSVEFAPTGF